MVEKDDALTSLQRVYMGTDLRSPTQNIIHVCGMPFVSLGFEFEFRLVHIVLVLSIIFMTVRLIWVDRFQVYE